MSLLESLLYDRPLPVPSKPRRVIAPEMIVAKLDRKRLTGTQYGSVQPRVLEYLGSRGMVTPREIFKCLDINYDSVVRALRILCKKGRVSHIRAFDPAHNTPSLWKIIGKEAR